MKSYKWFCIIYSALIDYINFYYAIHDIKQVEYINDMNREFMLSCKKQHGKYPKYIERSMR